jgi:phosphomannomutase/phosphoglucomutase
VKVVVAAGNGTAGRFVPPVFRELGCEVVELDCTPDWEFKRHNPNPEDISFLESIGEVTREEKADIGIGVDGDGDRIGVVDDEGEEVFSDKLGLVLARWIAKQHPERSLVFDVKGTGLFFSDEVLREAKMKIVMWKTGHSYIKAKVKEENAIAGFEKSGHWFLNAPYGRGYDDAVVSSIQLLKMLDEANAPLSHLLTQLPKTYQSPTLSPYCPDDEKYAVVEDITKQYQADLNAGTRIGRSTIQDISTVNGVRFTLEDSSWGLLRASSNKPCLVVVAESCTSMDQLYEIVDHIKGRLAETGKVGEYDQDMPERPGKV